MKSDLKEIAGHVAFREGAICTLQEVLRTVDRPQEIENDADMTFSGGEEGDADESQGWVGDANPDYVALLMSAITCIPHSASSHSGM